MELSWTEPIWMSCTCNEGDECDNPRHRMTRRECYEYRKQCFDWLLARGILTSSEEVSDWSMQSLIFCHYAPYAFMLKAPGTPRKGFPCRSLTWYITTACWSHG